MWWLAVLLGIGAVFVISSCLRPEVSRSQLDAPREPEVSDFQGDMQELLVTGYCNCGKCCGWRRRWFLFGEPVYNYGAMKGQPKKVGVTASGTVAARGTIAADVAVYPYGTKMNVPGYGTGTVRDIGGSIKGAHIDLWFPSHEEAAAWGARRLKVKVAKPKPSPKPKANQKAAVASKALGGGKPAAASKQKK